MWVCERNPGILFYIFLSFLIYFYNFLVFLCWALVAFFCPLLLIFGEILVETIIFSWSLLLFFFFFWRGTLGWVREHVEGRNFLAIYLRHDNEYVSCLGTPSKRGQWTQLHCCLPYIGVQICLILSYSAAVRQGKKDVALRWSTWGKEELLPKIAC